MIRLTAFLLFLFSLPLQADTQVTHTFEDGEVISAEEFNKNFDDLEAAIDAVGDGGGASPELVIAEQGNDLFSVTALCPSGKKVTGGGCRFNTTGAGNLRLEYCEFIESYPLSDLSGYGCVADPHDSGGDRCQVIRAYAICQ